MLQLFWDTYYWNIIYQKIHITTMTHFVLFETRIMCSTVLRSLVFSKTFFFFFLDYQIYIRLVLASKYHILKQWFDIYFIIIIIISSLLQVIFDSISYCNVPISTIHVTRTNYHDKFFGLENKCFTDGNMYL